jgi:hypothetical protein
LTENSESAPGDAASRAMAARIVAAVSSGLVVCVIR